jgi:hypothetical protein
VDELRTVAIFTLGEKVMNQSDGRNGRNGSHTPDGFLIVARCYKDDIPLGMFATIEEARQFTTTLTHKAVDEIGQRLGWSGLLGAEATFTVYSIAAVRFADGVPSEWKVVLQPDEVPWGYPEGYER